jgi:methionyl-tRNA formyltransferase
VIAATVIEDVIEPGRIDGFAVGTGAKCLRLDVVQPEGKQQMEASAWANGNRPTSADLLGA